jgi:hypothetical protein
MITVDEANELLESYIEFCYTGRCLCKWLHKSNCFIAKVMWDRLYECPLRKEGDEDI